MAWVFSGTGNAAEVRWPRNLYTHIAKDEPLPDLLREFLGANGIHAAISDKVTGVVTGIFTKVPPGKFLDQMASSYGLSWYYDGNILYVYHSSELKSHVLTFDRLDPRDLKKHLQDLQLWDPRFAWRSIPGKHIVYVSGPDRYCELVAEVGKALDQQVQERQSPKEAIKVFPLKYAWADDSTFESNGKQVKIPGVATTLRNLVAGSSATTISGRDEKLLPATSEKLGGKGLIARGHDEPKPQQGGAGEQNAEDRRAGNGASPFILADPRLNAVVVRAPTDRMPFYEDVIRQLDVAVDLVQIRATIVDVTTKYLSELGFEWKVKAKVGAGSITTGFQPKKELTPVNTPILGDGFHFASVLRDAGISFLSRINALEERGEAKILSRPSVVTVNNVEALLENSQTFYVKVGGYQQVDLFNVSAGVVLRVTPHVIKESDGTKIELMVNIEDGSMTEQSVDGIPVVQKSSINTHASVEEDQCLLIGGYFVETKITTEKKVPGLNRIPILGRLFTYKKVDMPTMERMFLIAPSLLKRTAFSPASDPDRKPEGGTPRTGNTYPQTK